MWGGGDWKGKKKAKEKFKKGAAVLHFIFFIIFWDEHEKQDGVALSLTCARTLNLCF